ncbi:monovalent cation/H(+) antiporter subunit G [Nocardioides sp. TF02-7]|uniref:monovalent cation/H(+) antiporter subunit G n=1 Tax=Nocardioides sp. TF02-7 TaxID=2917724 RepID=UPI001F057795|nr:monovalent cation/H(+) antiporter subunit G [Nocardioides sp. TF02-7]UMG91842.1 monovalent cation/H(+) antiporter subunit G [Nocardioides sp. TF02-7]
MIVLEWIGAVLMVTGGLLSVVAAVGMLRLPDVAARLQAATKPQTLGLMLIVVGAAPFLDAWSAIGMLVLLVTFQLVTAPVLAQLVARSAYRAGAWRKDRLVLDELAESEESS